MTLRKLILIALACALIAPLAVAQPPDDPGNGDGGADRGRGAALLRQLLPPAGYLQLTDEQRESLRGLVRELRDAVEPLRQEMRTLGEDLHEALNADAPDPAEIGQLTLDLRALRGQIRDQIAAFGDAFRAILDPEQQAKWDHFRELRDLRRRDRR